MVDLNGQQMEVTLSLRRVLNHLGKRAIPALRHGIVPVFVGVDTIAGHRGSVKSRPAVHHSNGAFHRRDRWSPFRNCLVQIYDTLPAFGAVWRVHRYDLGDLWFVDVSAVKRVCTPQESKTKQPQHLHTRIFIVGLLARICSTSVSKAPSIVLGDRLLHTSLVPRCIMTTSGSVWESHLTSWFWLAIFVARNPPWPSFSPS